MNKIIKLNKRNDYSYYNIYKIKIIGDSFVGKTSILNKYSGTNKEIKTTITFDFFGCECNIDNNIIL